LNQVNETGGLLMQPEAVRRRLDSLPDLAVQGKPVNGLFRLLASPLIWEMAYADIAPNTGAATPGSDGQSLDGFSEQRVRSIIARLMTGTYRFTPARRVTIPKASGGTRPLSIPSGDDKLVQAAVRLILERGWKNIRGYGPPPPEITWAGRRFVPNGVASGAMGQPLRHSYVQQEQNGVAS
jgi:hypothetical protein